MMKVFKNPCNYNDNTSGVATVLEIIDSLSDDELKNVAFILFDNEEKGKKGSSAYFKDHKDYMADKFVVNFDCVANGDNLIFIAQKDAVDSGEFKNLESSFEKSDEFSLDFCTYKEANSNSDHKNFPKGVGVVACKRSKNGLLYTPYIHTSRDVVASDENIKYLSQNIIRFIKRL
jgi:Zn-dependent M28 family amino/carboxypeptidase